MVFEEEEGGGVGGGGEEGEEERVFEGEKVVDSFEISLTNPRLFLQKTLVVVLASYAFIPVIYFFNEGDISAVAFAIILVLLHVAFIVIYLFRVKFRDLDGDWRSLSARILGLLLCLGLLVVVAETLSEKIWVLSLELLGLCCVHTLILALLMVEVRLPGAKRREKDEEEGEKSEEEYCLLPKREEFLVNGSEEEEEG